MLQLFGLDLPATHGVADRGFAVELATRMQAAVTALEGGAPVAVTASLRADAQRYLNLRRRGVLRLDGTARRACDEGAWALMRLTVDAPAIVRVTEKMVA